MKHEHEHKSIVIIIAYIPTEELPW